jgi:hypothetical protein
MNDRRHLAAILGFAFVAAWIGFNLGYAVLCLLGAGVFYALAGVAAGNVDLGELQERFTGRSSSGMSGAGTRAR